MNWLAVSGVTDATARLPSVPVLTSSSPSFPVLRLWHLILQSLCCKGNLNKLQPFLRLPGRTWMDLTLELFLMQPCSVLAAAMLDSKDPLFPRLVSQGQAHWLKLVVYLVGRFKMTEGLHFGRWTWRQKISIQSKSTKCPLFRQLLINHVSMKISPFHEAVVWE